LEPEIEKPHGPETVQVGPIPVFAAPVVGGCRVGGWLDPARAPERPKAAGREAVKPELGGGRALEALAREHPTDGIRAEQLKHAAKQTRTPHERRNRIVFLKQSLERQE
jgi:hypothetical protein